jgi:hypothetical protein
MASLLIGFMLRDKMSDVLFRNKIAMVKANGTPSEMKDVV